MTPTRIPSREHYDRLDLLGWAMLHEPTREAYLRSTGEKIAPAIDRYCEWVEENVIGKPEGCTEGIEALLGKAS